ncbi:MAG: magnesium transporter CorA family protein [Patescibacteria group bacterium]
MSSTQKIEFENFSWLNISNPDEQNLRELGEKYKFHPLDLADCLSTSQRTKIDVYPRYTFIVFRVPIYNRETREILPAEINIFISKNFLITIHHDDLQSFTDFFELLRLSTDLRQKYNEKSPEKLLYEILNKLFLYCFPMIDHLSIDCNNIEKAIFSGKERQMVSEILIIRRNITDFRKIMQVHKTVLKKMIYSFKENPLFVMKKTDAYFESLLDSAKEIWDTLENLKETIEALQETNESQISFKLSDTMRILTIISVFTFPLTLIAAIFGMNTVVSMPLVSSQFGFWYIIALMATIWLIMLAIFKKNNWL